MRTGTFFREPRCCDATVDHSERRVFGIFNYKDDRHAACWLYAGGRQIAPPPRKLPADANVEGETDEPQWPLSVWSDPILNRPKTGHPVLGLGVAACERGCTTAD